MLNKYWKLFWRFRRLSLLKALAYKFDALYWMFVGTVWSLFNLFFFSIIYQIDNGIAGWSVDELLLLISTFNIIDTFTWSFFHNCMRDYTDSIYRGTLDLILTKPVDLQFYLMAKKNSYTYISRFTIGVVGLVIAIKRLEIAIHPLNLFTYFILIINNLLIIYAIWFTLSTFAIYFDHLDNINNVMPSLRRIMQVPRQTYKGILSIILTTIIPLALVTSVPVEALLGKANPSLIIYSFLCSIFFIFISRVFFFYSLKKYAGVGG